MDIASISTALAQVNTQSAVGTAVLSNALDAQKVTGDGIVSMIDKSSMERSVNPSVGANVDVYL